MENKVRYATLTAVIAVAAGLFGAYGMSGAVSQSFNAETSSTAMMLGHVALTQTDANGNVIKYLQGDNLIVNEGEDCVLSKLFAVTESVGACEAADDSQYTVIAIGNGTGGGFDSTDSDEDIALGQEFTGQTGLTRTTASTITLTPSSGTTAAKAVLSNEFTNNAGATYVIAESGLFNGTGGSGDAMFAKQIFSNNVTLAAGESLTVEWTINVGGTATI